MLVQHLRKRLKATDTKNREHIALCCGIDDIDDFEGPSSPSVLSDNEVIPWALQQLFRAVIRPPLFKVRLLFIHERIKHLHAVRANLLYLMS